MHCYMREMKIYIIKIFFRNIENVFFFISSLNKMITLKQAVVRVAVGVLVSADVDGRTAGTGAIG
jgi:hypothetical protein